MIFRLSRLVGYVIVSWRVDIGDILMNILYLVRFM